MPDFRRPITGRPMFVPPRRTGTPATPAGTERRGADTRPTEERPREERPRREEPRAEERPRREEPREAPASGGTLGDAPLVGALVGAQGVDASVLRPLSSDVVDAVPDVAGMAPEDMIAAIRGHIDDIQRRFYAIGTFLRALDVPSTLRAMGYATLEDLWVGQGFKNRMQATRLRTAAVLPPDVALPLGLSKSYELVRWARVRKRARDDEEVVSIVRGTTEIGGTPMSKLSVGTIRRAIGSGRAVDRAQHDRRKQAMKEAISELRSALRKQGIDAKLALEDDEAEGTLAITMRMDELAAQLLAGELKD